MTVAGSAFTLSPTVRHYLEVIVASPAGGVSEEGEREWIWVGPDGLDVG